MLIKKLSQNYSVILLFYLLLLTLCPAEAWSGLTCNGVTNILGVEYVAECIDEGPPYRYVQTDIRCESGQVVKGPTQQWMNGGTAMMPAYAQSAIVNSAAFSSGKVFGNSNQTHYISVTNTFAKYNGILDGIALKPLAAAPTLHVDMLSGIGVIPKDLVDLDVDNDGYIVCDDCDDENLNVNPGATELCSDGLDNNCDNFTDCADSTCAEDPACLTGTDVTAGDFPPDPCLENH